MSLSSIKAPRQIYPLFVHHETPSRCQSKQLMVPGSSTLCDARASRSYLPGYCLPSSRAGFSKIYRSFLDDTAKGNAKSVIWPFFKSLCIAKDSLLRPYRFRGLGMFRLPQRAEYAGTEDNGQFRRPSVIGVARLDQGPSNISNDDSYIGTMSHRQTTQASKASEQGEGSLYSFRSSQDFSQFVHENFGRLVVLFGVQGFADRDATEGPSIILMIAIYCLQVRGLSLRGLINQPGSR